MSSLGDIDPIIVSDWDGFTQPETARVTALLGDVSSDTGNALIQQAALGFAWAALKGTLTDQDDLDDLNEYHELKTQVAFIHDSVTYVVIVFNLRVTRLLTPDDEAWLYTCTLHQVA